MSEGRIRLDQHGRKIYEPDGAWLTAFLRDRSPVSLIRGPIGSGTSSAACMKIFQMACEADPWTDGIKRTRWGIVRNTFPQLVSTTLKTWLFWFPENLYGPLKRSKPFEHLVRVGDVEMEVFFAALDDEDAISNLRSLEVTGFWFNELEYIHKAIFDEATSRAGRYPPKAETGKSEPRWHGVLADMNAPNEDHWLPQLMGEVEPPEDVADEDRGLYERPKDWAYFVQPPGLFEVKGEDGKTVTGYRANPDAENLKWLPGGEKYYLELIKGKRRSWIDSRVMNRITLHVEGRRVWPEFVPETHVAQRDLEIFPHHPVYLGIDFGRQPGVVFAQNVNDRWLIQHELAADDMSTSAFAPQVKRFLTQHYPECKYRAFGDPKGRDRGQNDEKTGYQVYGSNGIMVEPAPVKQNNIQTRIDTVATVLNQMRDGRPRLIVSPSCRRLKVGMAGGYHYRRIQGTQRYAEEPDKNRYSHVCFVAGTMIETPAGEAPIETLRAGDLVTTPVGAEKVVEIGNRIADTVRLQFSTGVEVTCTPDHPFMTGRGWVAARDLLKTDVVECAKQLKFNHCAQEPSTRSLSSWGCATIARRAGNIIAAIRLKVVESICTAPFGRPTLALYPRGTRSIIATKTVPTTKLPIWNAGRRSITRGITWPSLAASFKAAQIFKWLLRLPRKNEKQIQNGHPDFRALPVLLHRRQLQPLHQSMQPVRGAGTGTRSRLLIESGGFAPPLVRAWLAKRAALMMKRARVPSAGRNTAPIGTAKPVPVRMIARENSSPARVYNITVEEAHCYYAEGLLVSNCDALQYLLLGAGEGRAMTGLTTGGVGSRPAPVKTKVHHSRRRFG